MFNTIEVIFSAVI